MAIHADTAELELGVDEEPEVVAPESEEDTPEEPSKSSPAPPGSRSIKLAIFVNVAMLAAIASVGGWFGFQIYHSHQEQRQLDEFLHAARQGALDLTTISYDTADTDVQRVLAASTGGFRDDFEKRARPFIDVIKRAQSKTTGTIAEAGIESRGGNQAQVLVAVTVATTNTAAAEQQPRSWRMRISVQKTDDGLKMANVEFVP